MNAAIDALKAQIKNKKAALAKLRDQEEEFKRLQKAISLMPRIEGDLAALERSLKIVKGEEDSGTQITPQTGSLTMADMFGRESVPQLIYSVLKEAAKPQRIEQIMPLLAARGCTATEPTVRGAIYRNAKIGKMFRLVAPGTFGLTEWQ